MPDLEIAILGEKIGENSKNSKFRYKSSEYQNFTGFLAYTQKKNGNFNMFCKFQHHGVQIFFKMENFKCLKIEKGCIHPHLLTLTAYPTPGKVMPPFFFMKMTAKDVKEITYIPLVTFFSVLERPGKNRKGVATTPLG